MNEPLLKTADPHTLPLKGVSLVEASAGTGKTTALVRTYLRAVLADGLTVDELLVVTFTRAATGELTTRIRAALAEAHAMLSGEAAQAGFVAELIEANEAGEDQLLRRVNAAFTALDDSAVFTIHGFCQRMLADMAFETGGAFVTEQREEEEFLRREIAADFWRGRLAAASPGYARWFIETFKDPEGLLDELRDALAVSGELRVEPSVAASAVRKAEAAFVAAARAAGDAWREDAAELKAWLVHSEDLKRNKKYRRDTIARLVDDWEAWLASAPYPALPKNFERLTLEMAETHLKQGAVPDKPFFNSALVDALAPAAKALAMAWWQETFAAALRYLQGESRWRKREAREIGFDDMLQNLHDALRGPGGEVLAERIAARFPFAMVDEFQDTDPRQYAIFSGIYAGRENTGLMLIGDPKQAIYKFRGADVFTYMQARRRCDERGRVFGLTHNYRTTGGLIEAVNALFSSAPQPAFIYKEIPFTPVAAGREIAPLDTEDDAPLTLVWQSASEAAKKGIENKGVAEARAAVLCAAEIERLLVRAEEGKATFSNEDGECVRPRAADIAVLVPGHRHGDAVQQALRARGIASVTLSNDSVFETDEAGELEILLDAVAAPTNGPRLRRALATPLLGASAETMVRLGENEAEWGALISAFHDYRLAWQTEGFSVMFARLLREQCVIERTLARADGERAMTNLRHLAELADAHAAGHPGVEALLTWLGRERERGDRHRGDESRQLRLENDDELVRIVTLHKAKGLEYPIVFLPFLWLGKAPKKTDTRPAVMAHDDRFKAVLDLGSSSLKARIDDALEEERAEKLRLTYVALTRAKRACYLIAMPVKEADHSAFGKLLGIDDPAQLEAGLKRWAGQAPAGAIRMRAPEHAPHGLSGAEERPHGEARAFRHPDRLRQRFHIASYSRLVAGAHGGTAEQPERDEGVVAQAPVDTARGIHAFPAGAASGVFLHALLEGLPFDADEARIATIVERQLAAHGFDAHYWAQSLATWFARLFDTDLGAPGCRLADISEARRLNELEFHFRLQRIEAATLDRAVADYAPRQARPALHFPALAGQVKGYIDLIFEYGGRYWVCDYKSNRLGSELDDYTPAALDAAMAEHRYDLQYLLYTVAVHRYLKTRLPDYDYDRHFGGVLYLFLRGMAPDAPAPRGLWHTRPDAEAIRRLDQLLGGDDA